MSTNLQPFSLFSYGIPTSSTVNLLHKSSTIRINFSFLAIAQIYMIYLLIKLLLNENSRCRSKFIAFPISICNISNSKFLMRSPKKHYQIFKLHWVDYLYASWCLSFQLHPYPLSPKLSSKMPLVAGFEEQKRKGMRVAIFPAKLSIIKTQNGDIPLSALQTQLHWNLAPPPPTANPSSTIINQAPPPPTANLEIHNHNHNPHHHQQPSTQPQPPPKNLTESKIQTHQ